MAKKTNYDSEFCGSLPLNHINVIQQYGYLLVVDNQNFEILQASENTVQLFDREPNALVGALLSELTDTTHLKELLKRFESRLTDKIPLTLGISGKRLPAIAHFKEKFTLLEIEKSEFSSERTFTQVYEDLKYAIASLELCKTAEDVSAAAVKEIKRLTGFDSVMMYRFDHDWNGTVIAQAKTTPELDDYMGHTFPASDIPKQARELYLKNPYRQIPDREYQAVKLYPIINPVTKAFIDLSDCNLRGVASVHLEYLKNMNVSSSMSIRVIHNNTLWGLIACHHVKPLYVNFELCSICELLSSIISNRISAIIHQTEFDHETELQRRQTALIAQVYTANNLLTGLLNNSNNNLLQMFNAGGIVVAYQGNYEVIGNVPNRNMVDDMMLWLQHKTAGEVLVTDQLPDIFEEATSYADIASGALVIPISAEKGEFIICLRPEVVQTITWGGNPNNAINFDPDGKKYHPRASFKIWKETVRNTSVPWSKLEIDAANRLKAFINEYTSKKTQEF